MGFCLLREAPPVTASDEVMGPRHFIAPELEAGGRLDAAPAADIYALGKVIYYMISGGVVLPRERLSEAGFREIFANGQRYQLLEFLLGKMVCPLATRLTTMEVVIDELDRIEAWERKTPLLAVNSAGLDAAARLRHNAIERSQAREANTENWEQAERRLGAVRDSALGWVRSELTEVASQFSDGTALRMEVRDATVPTNDNILNVQTSERGGYRSFGGVELSLREAVDGFHRDHLLQVLLCREWQVVVIVNVVTPGIGGNAPKQVEPPRDVQLALVPVYRQTVDHEAPRASQMLGYLSRPERVRYEPRPAADGRAACSAWPEAAAGRRIFSCRAGDRIVSPRRDAICAVPPLGMAGPARGIARRTRHGGGHLSRGGSKGHSADRPLEPAPVPECDPPGWALTVSLRCTGKSRTRAVATEEVASERTTILSKASAVIAEDRRLRHGRRADLYVTVTRGIGARSRWAGTSDR